MTIKRPLLLLTMLAGLLTNSQAANEWIDVTSIFIQNPGFDNNSNAGWEWAHDGSGMNVRCECMEFWQSTFDIHQQLSGLPKGKYRLSVQSYYRPGSNSSEYQSYLNGEYEENMTAYLYANETEQKIVSVYSYSFDYNPGGCWSYSEWWSGTTYYFSNTMESASLAFGYGEYWNQIEFETEGDATIGLRNDVWRSDNWCIFDNFKLEYQGDVVKAQSISLNIDHTELSVGESIQCTATVLPENTLNKAVRWTSSNTRVATVDEQGLVTALEAGTTTLKVTTVDGSNLSKSVVLTVVRNTADATSLVINEIMASNIDEFISPAYNFDGWIELYNPSNKNVTLGGVYVSDDATNLRKWRMPDQIGFIPAKGFKVVWFDSNELKNTNAPFKLDVDGGTLYIADTNGQLIASQSYPASKERVSYARTTDGSSTWGSTSEATPGASNNSSRYADVQLAAPVVDQPSQLFLGTLTFNVTIPAGCTLRYTTDGTLPTMHNGQTSSRGQFSIGGTRCYRFRLFDEGHMLASPVTTRTYIYKERDYYLPVVAVVSDPDFLYDDSIGVYVRGVNGRPGNGQASACNWNMDWERPVNFSYLDEQGEMVLNQDADLEMCGGWSRAWTPHSFKLKGNKELGGNKHLPYAFFSQKPYIRNRTLQIRNGGNDTNARLKDPALQTIVQSSGIDIDCQSYEPVHEFINGQYIGVLNVREPNNKHYVYANYGWDDDEIDQFEMSPDSGYIQKCGTSEAYDELVDVLSADAANSETYAEICQVLDIDNYINYMATEFFLGGTDWPQNNVKGFRLRDGGKFRFVLFDLDGTLATNDPFGYFMDKEIYTFDPLYPTSLGRITAHIRFVTLFKNLLRNASFRRKFIDTYSIISGSVFEATRVVSIINQLEERVTPAMNLEGRGSDISNRASELRNNLSNRLNSATNALKNYATFGLTSTTAQSVTLKSDVTGAQLLINGTAIPTGRFNGRLFAPTRLKAVAPAGYAFQGWVSNTGNSSKTLMDTGSTWTYYDQGSLDNKNWTSPTYNTSNWQSGLAPLGYGNPNIAQATTLDYGGNASNKRPTYYFRTSITLDKAPTSQDQFVLSFTVDDGIIVYVNGQEAGRYNMPSGTVTYSTFATSYANDNPDTGTMTLDASLFKQGNNVLAVELHNNSANSTDILWDASLTATLTQTDVQDYYATEPEIALPKGTVSLTACYRPLTSSERTAQNICPVRINEISGSNNSLINEYGKKNDWVELYNTTDSDIDIEGMYLTDDLDKPTKYQITKGTTRANTLIPAHGHLIIWCDKLATTDQALHASFKISGDGGVLALMAANKSWTDELYYEAHDANTTVGRYPDGTNNVYAMNVQTIAKPNILTSYMTSIDQESLKQATDIRPALIASANGFRICYGARQLLIKSEEAQTARIDIFTTDGRRIEQQTVALCNGTTRMSIAHLPAGFYIARATNEEGTQVSCKFMVIN